ncbi:thrombospondin type 3 repeat-containing protein [Luteolibacter flavescens]|uniref:Thrombospondin type 3 repeat-containing protein n=1 Tax=Luteolibacter flavescens TaxID=1859460 RepID=A0ABT3FPD3_9BACT|nr:thrombospondin type 3 repeat-containing protein [Luteolibacter flavescens]MCW1884845.1 thrombospondin type 3 repeat-containing protein [Luteolibacter flavescens]
MKRPCFHLAAIGLILPCHAAPLAHESFDYGAGSALTSRDGGGGWAGAWYQDGQSGVAGADGLGFTDALGNVLDATGRCADTTGTATTRSLRVLGSGVTNDVWISFLWRLPASNRKFEGVSFYRASQQVFTVSNPSTTTTSQISLTSNLTANNSVNTQKGDFGTTHFVVLKLTKGGGAGGADRVDLFLDPVLAGTPSSPDAVISGSNFDIDRVRIAGEDGATLLVDELRVGETFADVAPHDPAGGPDSDGDGLTDAQEAVLGLNPNVDDSALIAAIRANPGWFGLHDRAGILAQGNGGVVLGKEGEGPVNLIFEVQHGENLVSWRVLETFNRQVMIPPGKQFLRITPASP